MTRGYGIVFAALLVAAGGFLWWWRARPIQTPVISSGPPTSTPILVPPPAAPAAPAIRHPLTASPAGGLPPLDGSDAYLKNALVDLLGRKPVLSFLRLDGVVHRFVATVDNLATEDAPAGLWPVRPTGGSFETEPGGGGLAIATRNADRYAPFVRVVAAMDVERAVALYRRLYPLLQRAYEDLGYPGKYFNDRVVDVIDNLLATPKVTGSIKLKRFAADGGAPGAALYLYDDPALEASSAGQKILLRMVPDNAAALEAKLREIRARLVTGPTARR